MSDIDAMERIRLQAERDRLRAQNAELKQCADAAITDKFREVAKVERLRAQNAELLAALQLAVDSDMSYINDEAVRIVLRAAIAKAGSP